MTKIYVGNLPNHTDAKRLGALFTRFGNVASIHVTPGSSRHRFDGFGLIEMDEHAARKAIAGLDGQVFDRVILSVREQTESPPRGSAPIPTEETPTVFLRPPYEVITVEKADGPRGADGDDWKRYVLSSGRSRITGFHRGTLEEVAAYATTCAADFNLRSASGKSPRALAYAKKT